MTKKANTSNGSNRELIGDLLKRRNRLAKDVRPVLKRIKELDKMLYMARKGLI